MQALNNKSPRRHLALTAALMMATALGGGALTFEAQAQSAQASRSFNIAAQPLPSALTRFGRQSGLQVSVSADLVEGRRSSGVTGDMTASEALSRLLVGTGLTYRITGNTVTLEKAPETGQAIQLGPIRVEGGDQGGQTVYGSGLGYEGDAADRPYATSGSAYVVSGPTIERFRGQSAADIFRTIPGVESGDARNGGGIDLNIRGMQGMGRVAVTIDGADNPSSHLYHGYQGIGNRSFVDPDFLSGIDVRLGPDAASSGAAGTVRMRTLGVADILRGDETFAIRLKGGFGTNTSDAETGQAGGLNYSNVTTAEATAAEKVSRPNLLQPTSDFASVVAAGRIGNAELLAGYVYRDQGNYHAGTDGPSAEALVRENYQVCNTVSCTTYPVYVDNAGLTAYRAGEQVFNTSARSESGLLKAAVQLTDDQRVEVGFNLYRGESGHRFAVNMLDKRVRPSQWTRSRSEVDTLTARYLWNPADNDQINLEANLWRSDMKMRYRSGSGSVPSLSTIGLTSAAFLVGSDTTTWGLNVTNRSALYTSRGDVRLEYGLSYLDEATAPSLYTYYTEAYPPKHGKRQEVALFGKGEWQVSDTVSLNAGLRYQSFRSQDQSQTLPATGAGSTLTGDMTRDGDAFAPSVGISYTPWQDVQLYLTYAEAARLPSLMESGTAFMTWVDPDLKPERTRSWETGVNVNRTGQFRDGDKTQLKFNYFRSSTKDYISRHFDTLMRLENIDEARFEGIELSGRYLSGAFTAELAASYYFDARFCRKGEACEAQSLYGDYATNQVPPEYRVNLTLSQGFFDDRLLLGARGTWVGERIIPHEAGTVAGASQFIVQVGWQPYSTYDLFGEYRINDLTTLNFTVSNVGDTYYLDPLSLVLQPAPGRTVNAYLTRRFGAGASTGQVIAPFEGDWAGLYIGAHSGYSTGRIEGDTTTAQGVSRSGITREAPDQKLHSGLYGFQFGYNQALSARWVAGFEADLSALSGYDHKGTVSLEEARTEGYKYLEAMNEYGFDWMATLRARLGFSHDRTLYYVTAGPAWLRETQSRTQFVSRAATSSSLSNHANRIAFIEKDQQTRKGFSLGGGVEYALNRRMSVKAEYLYAGFGKHDFLFPEARQGVTLAHAAYQITTSTTNVEGVGWVYERESIPASEGTYNTIEGRKARSKAQVQTLRVGLNYRF